tara:strand:+ start:796 stop:1317 length:522 start_codon:yes stop_codon:yes gene_type:complete
MPGGKGFGRDVITTSIAHHRIHQGTFFEVNILDLAVASAGTLDVLVRVVSSAHMRIHAAVSADFLAEMTEAPITTLDGTPVTAFNLNRFSSRVASTLLFQAPTITDIGAPILEQQYLPGGSGGNAIGAQGSTFEEILMSPGDYLLRLTNISGQANIGSMNIDFYEPPEGAPKV